jgi:hypothetical protein
MHMPRMQTWACMKEYVCWCPIKTMWAHGPSLVAEPHSLFTLDSLVCIRAGTMTLFSRLGNAATKWLFLSQKYKVEAAAGCRALRGLENGHNMCVAGTEEMTFGTLVLEAEAIGRARTALARALVGNWAIDLGFSLVFETRVP